MEKRAHPLDTAARQAATAIIRRRAGSAVSVVGEDPLGHQWAPVTRLRLAGTPAEWPSSVVVKTVRTRGAGHGSGAHLRREIVAHQLAGPSGVVVELIGADLDAGVIVLGDAGEGPTVEAQLVGRDREGGAAAFLAIGDALGRLHAATVGLGDAYREMLVARGATADDLAWAGLRFGATEWANLTTAVAALGLPSPDRAGGDVERLLFALTAGVHTALLHSDSNPGNCVTTPEGVVLVDFEGSMFGSVGLDLAELDYPFPFYSAHWATVPSDVSEAAFAAYAQHLPPSWRDHLDEIRVQGAASAVLHRMLRLPVVAPDDQPPAKRWRRRAQLVQQIDRFLELEGGRHFPALAEWLGDLHGEFVARWSDATDPAPTHFPAFGGPYRPTR